MIVSTTDLRHQYSNYSNPLDKIKRDTDNGVLIRLNRGIYETDKSVDPCFVAAAILSPSYLSFEFALSFYGLIPERVVAITSATLLVRKTKSYTNKLGRFEFRDVPSAVFSEGLAQIGDGKYIVTIATKEKALCDSLSKWRVIKSIKQLKVLLFEDKRIDEEEFASCDFFLMRRLARLYHKTNLNYLIKLIEKEYIHE